MSMATKSFQTDFAFNKKNGHALANALEHSRRVDIVVESAVNRYNKMDEDKLHKKFDSLFRSDDQH